MDYLNENLIGILSAGVRGDLRRVRIDIRKGNLRGFKKGVLAVKIKNRILRFERIRSVSV